MQLAKMRAPQSAAGSSSSSSKTPVRKTVKRLFLKKGLSAQDVQELSSGITDVSAGHEEHCRSWAKAGAAGKHPRNAARDIMRKMVK